MEYDLKLSQCESYVFVRPFVNVTKNLAHLYTREAISLGNTLGISKLLVDVRGLVSLSGAMGKYAFAHGDGKRIGLTHLWQVALIYDEGNEDIKFLETVMRNAGYNYRVFGDESQARAWLLEES